MSPTCPASLQLGQHTDKKKQHENINNYTEDLTKIGKNNVVDTMFLLMQLQCQTLF